MSTCHSCGKPIHNDWERKVDVIGNRGEKHAMTFIPYHVGCFPPVRGKRSPLGRVIRRLRRPPSRRAFRLLTGAMLFLAGVNVGAVIGLIGR